MIEIPDWRPVFGLSNQEFVTELDDIVLAERALAARRLELIASAESRGIPRAHGCVSVSMWLRTRFKITPGAMVRLARQLPSMPHLTKALAAGEISEEQASIVAAAVAEVPAGLTADAEHFLVREGAALVPEQLKPFGKAVFEFIAPDLAEEKARKDLERDEQRAADDRSFTVAPDGTGRFRIHGYTCAEGAAIIASALDPLTNPARYRQPGSTSTSTSTSTTESGTIASSSAEAAVDALLEDDAFSGNGTGAFRDPRTPRQRRHDALLEVFGISLKIGDLPDNGGNKAQIVVTMPYDPVAAVVGAGLLDSGCRLSPDAVRRLACDAGIIPAICDGNGIPLDVGRERRLFTGALRRVLVLRDKGCAFPGCDRPPKWTDGHHLIHWADGGKTCLENGVLVCVFHHRLLHEGDWQVYLAADGIPEFVPPAYLDPDRRPRRNLYHRRN